jgi:HEAT repeat protein
MSTIRQPISEATLTTNLNELAQTLVRELTMACRKVAVYGSNHPTALRAVERPFFALNEIFRFRNHANLNLHEGTLYVLNISPKKNVFTEELVRRMLTLDIEAILINRRVTMTEFSKFIDRFVKRVSQLNHENLLGTYLQKNRIDTIEVNTEKAFKFFEAHKKYRGEIFGDYSVKKIALQQLGNDLEVLADINRRGQEALDEQGIDFHIDVVRYLFAEKIGVIPAQELAEKLLHHIQQINAEDDEGKKESLIEKYKSLHSLVDHHPQRAEINSILERYFTEQKLPPDMTRRLSTPVGVIRVETSEQVDAALQRALHEETTEYDITEFGEAFRRLLMTGQRGKAVNTLSQLIDSLLSPEAASRQKALELFLHSVRSLNLPVDAPVFEQVIERVENDLKQKKDTFEYSEVLRVLLEKCLVSRRFDLMARLTKAMAGRRKVDNNVTVYDSMAVKKALEHLTRREVIDTLIDEMIKADHDTFRHLREIFIATGSEEVAVALSHIISHPVRQVRQKTLKVLTELGKASLQVFSRILMDDAMFERSSDRHELPDNKWYIIRNSIFVLGSLRDPEGVVPLRLRIGDPDVRVRREIVGALEKIGGEDACDLLLLMADDPDKEIRECAVIAVGLIGTPDTVPMLIDLAHRNPSVAVRVVGALGKIGGEQARSYLIRLLSDDDALAELAANQVPKEELRLAVIKALGNIGDKEAIETLKDYRNNLSTTQRIFLRHSPVNKAISEILSRY